MKRSLWMTVLLLATTSIAAWAQPGGGCCRGQRGGMQSEAHQKDTLLFHYLLDHRDEITRTIEELPDGVLTVTESDSPEVAAKIQEHVESMYARVGETRPIHVRDPLFAEIFRHADAIDMSMEKTDKGVRVRETSKDPYVAKLIKAHAEVVTRFLENGRPEMRRDHAVPAK
jgi:hypothetical protein